MATSHFLAGSAGLVTVGDFLFLIGFAMENIIPKESRAKPIFF